MVISCFWRILPILFFEISVSESSVRMVVENLRFLRWSQVCSSRMQERLRSARQSRSDISHRKNSIWMIPSVWSIMWRILRSMWRQRTDRSVRVNCSYLHRICSMHRSVSFPEGRREGFIFLVFLRRMRMFCCLTRPEIIWISQHLRFLRTIWIHLQVLWSPYRMTDIFWIM